MRANRIYVALALSVVRMSGQGFESPIRIDTTVSSGYYNTYSRGEANQAVSFVPLGAKFDINGSFLSPDLMTYSLQPELNLGPQASEAGFQGGNGIRLRLLLLRKRFFPISFRYSNIQLEDVYYGSLSQVSAYSLKNRNRDLGINWEIAPHGLPHTTIDWGIGSSSSQSGNSIIPDYDSRSKHFNADSRYEHWGWNFQGFAHLQHFETQLFAPMNAGTYSSSLTQGLKQFQGSASRSLFSDSELNLTGGTQSTASILYDLPIDLTTRFASANLRLFQKRRWKTSLHSSYSSNFSSQLLSQVLAGSGPGSIAPDQSILNTLQHQISNISVSGVTSLDLTHGFGIYGNFDRSSLIDANQLYPLSSSYFSTTAGVTYSQNYKWGRFSGQYGREFGHGSVTGQSGSIQGQSYMINAQRGKGNDLVIEGSVHGNDQTVVNLVPISSKSFATDGSISRGVVRNFRARIGGGYQWGTFQNGGSEFRSDGYTARAGVDHPRLQASISLNNSYGNSLPVYSQLIANTGLDALLLAPVHVIPSDFRATSFNIHSNPIRKLEFSATYTHSRQHLDTILNNDFELLNAHATYHFRRVQLDSGYIRSRQIFIGYPETRRGRFYVRISRSARLL